MLIKTRAIVFRTIKYAETSLICDFYTEELGLKSYLVSGVRTKKPKFSAGLLQVMSLLDTVVYHRAGNALNRPKEIKSAFPYETIPFDIRKSAIGQFMAELCRKTIKEEEANPSLFNFLFESYSFLDGLNDGLPYYPLWFMIQLTGYLGFMPSGNYDPKTPFFDLEAGYFCAREPVHPHFLKEKEAQLFWNIITQMPEDLTLNSANKTERKSLLEKMILFYRYHMENFKGLNSHEILEVVLA